MSWLALALALSHGAHASAYYFLDAGTRGMARGGAFVASADDPSAQHYNPAALIHLDRPQLMINFALVDQNVSFTRSDAYGPDDTTSAWPVSENIGPPMAIPTMGFASRFGLENWAFALGMYNPYAPDMKYPTDGAQRYTLVDSLVWQIKAGPSAAWRPVPWLTVGAGLTWTLVRAEQELAVALCVDDLTDDLEQRCPEEYYGHGYESRENDVNIAMKMVDPFTPTWNAGLLVDPVDWLTVGASFQPPVKVAGKGTLSAHFSDDHWLLNPPYEVLDGQDFEDEDITVSLTLPMIARLGIAVRPAERLEVELAGVYEGWHATRELLVSDVDLVLKHDEDSPFVDEDITITDDVVLPADYRDAFSVRLGGQYDFDKLFSLRAGAFYESSAVPPETQGVAVVDGSKFGYAAGGSWLAFKYLSVDFAVLQTWIKARTITDSEQNSLEVPVNLADFLSSDEPPALDIVDGPVVGNGTFASNQLILSVGLTGYFK